MLWRCVFPCAKNWWVRNSSGPWRGFVRVQPPSSPLLMLYGEAFADFIDGFEAAGSVGFLSDVARFEYARGLAYHAKDAAVLEPAHLSAVSPDLWGACRFTLHPAVKILRSRFAILSIRGRRIRGRMICARWRWMRLKML